MTSVTPNQESPKALEPDLPVNLPYFDFIIDSLDRGVPEYLVAWNRHVHWGVWDDPATYDGTPENYARASERLTQMIIDKANIRSGQAILDTGCGFGGTIASINERISDATLVGLNIDARQLDRARKNVQPLSGNTIEFVHGDACKMPFPDASFDNVFAVECIFHFPSREDYFAEVRRVLKPGGHLVISDYTPPDILAPAIPLIFRTYGAPALRVWGRLDYTGSRHCYRQLAKRHGFSAPVFHDITREHMPSYEFLMQRPADWSDPNVTNDAVAGTDVLRKLSKYRILRYQIVSFVRR